MLRTAMKINNNRVPIMKGRFVPAATLALGLCSPAAGDRVPEEQGEVLQTAKAEARFLSRPLCRRLYIKLYLKTTVF